MTSSCAGQKIYIILPSLSDTPPKIFPLNKDKKVSASTNVSFLVISFTYDELNYLIISQTHPDIAFSFLTLSGLTYLFLYDFFFNPSSKPKPIFSFKIKYGHTSILYKYAALIMSMQPPLYWLFNKPFLRIPLIFR